MVHNPRKRFRPLRWLDYQLVRINRLSVAMGFTPNFFWGLLLILAALLYVILKEEGFFD
jgi:hypothetical protein